MKKEKITNSPESPEKEENDKEGEKFVGEKVDKTKKEKPEKKSTKKIMDSLFEKIPELPTVGELIEGKVIGIEKNSIFIDLPPFGTGIIYGREFMNVRDVVKNLNIGDSIAAKIVEVENKDGYIELEMNIMKLIMRTFHQS